MNYPRRQQYRRLGRALATGAGGLLAAGAALLAAAQGALWIALLLLVAAVGLGAYARHWARLAGRSRVGARSEKRVQRALAPLATEGSRLRHSLAWQGRGDIDSVAIAPTRVAFAIETKTRTFDGQHVARVHEMANWLRARRRRWCRQGALAVLCVVHARRLERVEAGVLIVSLDRLIGALRTAAGTCERPTFLAGREMQVPVERRSGASFESRQGHFHRNLCQAGQDELTEAPAGAPHDRSVANAIARCQTDGRMKVIWPDDATGQRCLLGDPSRLGPGPHRCRVP